MPEREQAAVAKEQIVAHGIEREYDGLGHQVHVIALQDKRRSYEQCQHNGTHNPLFGIIA
jgi:hypothetical protein